MSPDTKLEVLYIGATDEQVRWGGCDDPREVLKEGMFYTLIDFEVHSWHTKYTLREFPDKKFNSVHFQEF